MQNIGTMIRRPVSFGAAAAGGVLALLAGMVIALTAPGLTAELSVDHATTVTQSIAAVGAEQIAHDRSELGPADFSSVGAQQVSHNRSEEGLTGE